MLNASFLVLCLFGARAALFSTQANSNNTRESKTINTETRLQKIHKQFAIHVKRSSFIYKAPPEPIVDL